MEDLMKSVIVVGTGGFAIELIPILQNAGVRIEGCIGPRNRLTDIWLGEENQIVKYIKSCSFLVAIGDANKRAKVIEKLISLNAKLLTFIAEKSYVAESVKVGVGTLIYPGACVHAQVSLGVGVLVNSGVSIGHETTIGDFTNISPGAAIGGNCSIGKGVHVGIGSSIIEKICVADGVMIGAGASVIRTIQDNSSMYAGVPALKKK